MPNAMYASEDGLKLGIFEGDSNHLLLFNYIEYLDIVEVKIMRGEVVEARLTIEARENQYGRWYEGLIGLEHYFARIRETLEKEDNQKHS